MKKVKLEYEQEVNQWGEQGTRLVVYVDDKLLGIEYYGCEPEDNSPYRHYAWVRELMESLALELGAEVELDYKVI